MGPWTRSAFAGLLALAAPAQETPAPGAPPRGDLRLVHRLPLGKDGVPSVQAHAHGTSFHRLCWQGTGDRLFLSWQDGFDPQTRGPRWRLTAIDATGKATDATPADGAQCLGASAHGPFLLGGGELRASGAGTAKPFVVGDRADAWLSPFALRAVVTTMERGLVTRLVDLESGEAKSLRMSRTFPALVAFAADGRMAIARAQAGESGELTDEGIAVLGADGSRLLELPGHGSAPTVLAFADDGRRLVFADGRLHLVEVDGGKELASVDIAARFWAALAPGIAVGHDGAQVRLHDPATLQVLREVPLAAAVPTGVPERQAGRGPILLAAAAGARVAFATYDALLVFEWTAGK